MDDTLEGHLRSAKRWSLINLIVFFAFLLISISSFEKGNCVYGFIFAVVTALFYVFMRIADERYNKLLDETTQEKDGGDDEC